ncbi:hypothetical protein AB0E01_15820 [Nocardia vinacea]|uniref:hypothetical protein n=1 Tax=Nocardia vinacea TaxID=96468 RepID=UPI00340F427E
MKIIGTDHRHPAAHYSLSPDPHYFPQREADHNSIRRASWHEPRQRIRGLGRGLGAFGPRPGRLLGRLNNRVAVAGTKVFGTMRACYCFAAFGLVPLVDSAHQATYMYWSNFIQLVALPMLMVGTARVGAELGCHTTDGHDPASGEFAQNTAGPGGLVLRASSAQPGVGGSADASEFDSSGHADNR